MLLHALVQTLRLDFLFPLRKTNRPFLSCFEPHCESEAKCKVFVMKISFHSYGNKTNFHIKSFALSLAFIVRFKATLKWPIRQTQDHGEERSDFISRVALELTEN